MKRILALLLFCAIFFNNIAVKSFDSSKITAQNDLHKTNLQQASCNNFIYNIDNTSNQNLFPSKKDLNEEGLNTAKMVIEGIPILPGFIVKTQACGDYHENNFILSEKIKTQVLESIKNLENLTNKKFYTNFDNTTRMPLLFSVRAGAKSFLPGMTDTMLNVGMNELAVKKMIDQGFKKEIVYDMYLKFIKNYSKNIAQIEESEFKNIIGEPEEKVLKYKKIYKEKVGTLFPENPQEQMFEVIETIFKSWGSSKLKLYRQMREIEKNENTSIIVQCMAFGNLYENSAKGIAFSRNPITGEDQMYGSFIINAENEDIINETCSPLPIQKLEEKQPEIYAKLKKVLKDAESTFGDMQCVEFIAENGNIYIVKTSSAKCNAEAKIKTALDLVYEGKITKEEAILRISPEQIKSILYSHFKPECLKSAKKIAKGLPTSPGVAVGRAVFSVEDAEAWSNKGESVILVRKETVAKDIPGMQIAQGILTTRGGMTSHAAVVARGMGKCCISGCEEIEIHEKSFSTGNVIVHEGDFISLNGNTGEIYIDKIEIASSHFSNDIAKFLDMANSKCNIKILANADNVKDVDNALKLGAKGVGLCRTEHMFFGTERINLMYQMILASTKSERCKALEKLLLFQQKDFKEMFTALKDKPFTIRLIDPPLHEFLPKSESDISKIAEEFNVPVENVFQTIEKLKESNPMMGHRGCRLLISHPEIIEMQVKAIIGAAIEVQKENPNCTLAPEIMIPLINDVEEVKFIKKIITKVADSVIHNLPIDYKIGVMIETPRAALLADKIASEVDFFSFGTNDLTQMTFGFSRDDSQKFLNHYYENNIYKSDPFINIDHDGVGKLIKMAITLGKNANPNLKIGICGEHGGDSQSIEFLSKLVGLDYISCSPFRIPVARISAAINTIKKITKIDCTREEIFYDNWLDISEKEIKKCSTPIVDLGCGSGNDTLYLLEKGKQVIPCDCSEETIKNIQKNFPEIERVEHFDMVTGLPFTNNFTDIVIADLSLHYFSEKITFSILQEIKRILKPDGLLLLRVNSINDINYGAGQGLEIEKHFYQGTDNRYKRFFDEKDIRHFFKEWNITYMNEEKMERYEMPKEVWHCTLKCNK